MIKYNNTILNPKNIDFVDARWGTVVEICYASGEKCSICTKNAEETTQLIDNIYKDMEHNWSCELRTR